MKVTTSSPKTFTNKLAKAGDSDMDDQYIIDKLGLDPSLRGEALDAAAEEMVAALNQKYRDESQ